MLFRLFSLTFVVLVFNLYACKGGYTSCIAKVKDSHTIQHNVVKIPLANNLLLLYSNKTPNAKIIKHDPFLSLYLVKDENAFKYPFDINMRLQLGTALVNNKVSYEGEFTQNQIGLNRLAHYSEALIYPALVTSSCCSLEGIVTQRGIIQKEYLKRFVTSKNTQYGDIGIRLKNDNNAVIVTDIDPYFANNPFKQGDCIVKFDGKKVSRASVLMRTILFSKIGTKHKVKVKRAKKYFTFLLTTAKRYGGGDLSDTFLESQGVFFSRDLSLVEIKKHFREYGLKKGDRLLQINNTKVKNQKELQIYIQKNPNYSKLLFERNHFQFFVNIK
ncbi:DUF7488 domain-containing protein [Sulfurimonas sp.]